MEQTECSETSAYVVEMQGNYPEESIERVKLFQFFLPVLDSCILSQWDLILNKNSSHIRSPVCSLPDPVCVTSVHFACCALGLGGLVFPHAVFLPFFSGMVSCTHYVSCTLSSVACNTPVNSNFNRFGRFVLKYWSLHKMTNSHIML